MIRAAFLSFYRSLTRHPLYSALNLLGLSFGIAVFIVLSLYVRFETSYEQWLPNSDRIYVLAHRTPMMINTGKPFRPTSAGYALDVAHTVYPDLVGTRVVPVYAVAKHAAIWAEETGQIVDVDFFKVFDLPVVAGDRDAALTAPDGLILTESTARKYFGRTDVVGERLFLKDAHSYDAGSTSEMPWRVMAVLKDIPANSTLTLTFVRGLTAYRAHGEAPDTWYWWGRSQDGQTFVLLPPGQTAGKWLPAIARALKAYPLVLAPSALASVPKTLQFDLQPFASLHLASESRRRVLSGLVWTASFALIVALINYVNLATALASMRGREMAMRRVNGATGSRLILQILAEAALAGGAGLLLALSLLEVGLPVLNWVEGSSLRMDYGNNMKTLAALASVVVVANLLAAFYPATVLARFRPTAVLGISHSPGSGAWGSTLREGLIVLQFTVTCTFFIIVAGFAAEVQHMETSDLGFSRRNILVTGSMPRPLPYEAKSQAVINAWRRLPGIESLANGDIPGRYYRPSSAGIIFEASDSPTSTLAMAWTGPDFFKVYETPLLAGRVLSEKDDAGKLEPDRDALINLDKIVVNVVINQSAVKLFGFANSQTAIGKELSDGLCKLHVVGVVADQRLQGPKEKTRPTVYGIRLPYVRFFDIIIRYAGVDEATARQRLTAEWRKIMPEWPLEFTTIRQELDYYYRDDRRNTRLFAIGGGVAALIGAVGLFGMAAFNTSARVHEIGIRKAQGASRWRIMRLLMFQFLRPVLIANLIAWPIAYIVLDAWLKQFDDRVAMSPWFFLAGSGLSILIAAVTVFGVAWSGANLSPAKALRQL